MNFRVCICKFVCARARVFERTSVSLCVCVRQGFNTYICTNTQVKDLTEQVGSLRNQLADQQRASSTRIQRSHPPILLPSHACESVHTRLKRRDIAPGQKMRRILDETHSYHDWFMHTVRETCL